jgi:hypothetical protein
VAPTTERLHGSPLLNEGLDAANYVDGFLPFRLIGSLGRLSGLAHDQLDPLLYRCVVGELIAVYKLAAEVLSTLAYHRPYGVRLDHGHWDSDVDVIDAGSKPLAIVTERTTDEAAVDDSSLGVCAEPNAIQGGDKLGPIWKIRQTNERWPDSRRNRIELAVATCEYLAARSGQHMQHDALRERWQRTKRCACRAARLVLCVGAGGWLSCWRDADRRLVLLTLTHAEDLPEHENSTDAYKPLFCTRTHGMVTYLGGAA